MNYNANAAAVQHEGHAAWGTSTWPVVISFGILALTFAFMLQFVYELQLAAIISLGIGLPLIIGGIAGWTSEAMGEGEGLSFACMGWFILAETMIFLACFMAYWYGRLGAPMWPLPGSVPLPPLIPVIMTITLVTSSVTIHRTEHYVKAGDSSGASRWLLLSILLGAAFLVMTGLEWTHLIGEGFTIKTNLFGTVLYSITGLHGSHVLVGLSIFIAGLYPVMRGNLSVGFWRTAGLYWHFVDIIWFFVVSQIYFW